MTAFMFPHAGFIDVLCQLGFNRNDGIINMMPIVTEKMATPWLTDA